MINTLCILPLKVVVKFYIALRLEVTRTRCTLITGAINTLWSYVVTSSVTVGG
jgi:hypothetical protein